MKLDIPFTLFWTAYMIFLAWVLVQAARWAQEMGLMQ